MHEIHEANCVDQVRRHDDHLAGGNVPIRVHVRVLAIPFGFNHLHSSAPVQQPGDLTVSLKGAAGLLTALFSSVLKRHTPPSTRFCDSRHWMVKVSLMWTCLETGEIR